MSVVSKSPSSGNNCNNQTFICDTSTRTCMLQSPSESLTYVYTGICLVSKYVCVPYTNKLDMCLTVP